MTDLEVKTDLENLTIRILEQSKKMYQIEEIRNRKTGWTIASYYFPENDEEDKTFYIRGKDRSHDDYDIEVTSLVVLKQIIETLSSLNKRGYKVVIKCRTEL